MLDPSPKATSTRLVCSANQALQTAVTRYMTQQGFSTQSKAVEFLVRDGLQRAGILPTSK